MGLQNNLVSFSVRVCLQTFLSTVLQYYQIFLLQKGKFPITFLLLFLVLPPFPFFFGSILRQRWLSHKAGHKWLSSSRRLQQWVCQSCSGISIGVVQHHGQSLTAPCQGGLVAWGIPPHHMEGFLRFSNVTALGRWRCLYSRARTKPQALSTYVLK